MFQEYSNRILTCIPSDQELSYYHDLNLVEWNCDTYCSLIRRIDWDLPNLGRALSGHSPVDYDADQIIELHHIGQEADAPFAELLPGEHRSSAAAFLHDPETRSMISRSSFRRIRQSYWKARALDYLEPVLWNRIVH